MVRGQEREGRIEDVAVPVTAISGDWLVSNNQVRLTDYYSKLPGVNLTVNPVVGQPDLRIRGLSTGAGAAVVSYVVDEVPYGSAVPGGGLTTTPDFDPGDLARIEVLRGPQGTLYGASGVGGLLKFATIDPSTAGVNARVQVGGSIVSHGAVGDSVRGAINVPLSNTFAVRVSGFTRQDPG